MKNNIVRIICLQLIGIGLLTLSVDTAQAQQKEVREAQALYRQIKRMRERGRLFESVSELNKGGLRVPRIGAYNRVERYFYRLSTEKKPTLCTILIKIERNNIRYNQEFLYSPTGDPLYIFESQNDFKNYKYRTLKVYYKNKVPIQWVKGRAVIDGRFLTTEHKKRVEELWEKAKRYYKKYEMQIEGIEEVK